MFIHIKGTLSENQIKWGSVVDKYVHISQTETFIFWGPKKGKKNLNSSIKNRATVAKITQYVDYFVAQNEKQNLLGLHRQEGYFLI
jgi:hypothetical protein